MEITGDLATQFFKLLHDINQDIKKAVDSYLISGDKIYASSPDQQIYRTFAIIQPVKATAECVDLLTKNNLTFRIDAQEFFQFQKDFKNADLSIKFLHDQFIIDTGIPGVQYKTFLEKKFMEEQERYIKQVMKDVSASDVICKVSIDNEFFNEFKKIRVSGELLFDINNQTVSINSDKTSMNPAEEHSNIIPVIIHSKYFLKFVKSTEGNIILYRSKDSPEIIIVEIILDNKKYKTHQFFRCLAF